MFMIIYRKSDNYIIHARCDLATGDIKKDAQYHFDLCMKGENLNPSDYTYAEMLSLEQLPTDFDRKFYDPVNNVIIDKSTKTLPKVATIGIPSTNTSTGETVHTPSA